MTGLPGQRDASPVPAYGIASWLAKRAFLDPRKVAVIEGGKRFTYAELDDRVTRLAGFLHVALRISRGDRVATCSVNCSEFIEVLFATARIGALLVPLNWRLAPRELEYQLKDSGARALFVAPEQQALATSLESDIPTKFRIVFGPQYESALAGNAGIPIAEADQARFADPHLILYTAGTTGRPKGAMLTHANQFWNSVNMTAPVGLTAFDTTITTLPMFHSGGIGLYTVPMIHLGGTVVVIRAFEPESLLDLVREHSVRLIFGVPAIWLELLKRPDFDVAHLPSLRFCVSGGAPHPMAIINGVAERGFTFLQGYGLTETAPGGTLMPIADAKRKAATAGKPALHVELRVVADDERACAPDEIGEVQFKGPNVFAGYWGRPDATAEAFTADGWFRTGDLGRLDDEGFLTLVDRKKDMVITGAENVYSAEVEDVLFAHPAVAEAAVIGIPDPKWGESVFAVVVLRPGASATAEELIAHSRSQLAKYKTPTGVAFVDALPRNAAGKVLKRELRERFGGARVE
ncbi:MAG TPA: long-chain fatty acid--CoA ligase [Candidatus Limnocylindria bacterium]